MLRRGVNCAVWAGPWEQHAVSYPPSYSWDCYDRRYWRVKPRQTGAALHRRRVSQKFMSVPHLALWGSAVKLFRAFFVAVWSLIERWVLSWWLAPDEVAPTAVLWSCLLRNALGCLSAFTRARGLPGGDPCLPRFFLTECPFLRCAFARCWNQHVEILGQAGYCQGYASAAAWPCYCGGTESSSRMLSCLMESFQGSNFASYRLSRRLRRPRNCYTLPLTSGM